MYLDLLKNVLQSIKFIPEGNIFIFCDTDICFKENFTSKLTALLKKHELVAQNSISKNKQHKFCSGFYAGVKSDNTVKFLRHILKNLKLNVSDNSKGDQYFFNIFSSKLKIKQLNSKYLSLGHISKSKTITTDQEIDKYVKQIYNKNIYLLHANYIKGTYKKYKLLKKYFKSAISRHSK
jgi:hypothetical protein